MSRASFAKRAREQAKKTKAEAKRERRLAMASEETDAPAPSSETEPQPTTEEVLRRIEEIHRLHEEGAVDDEELQTTKAELLGQLQID